LGGNAINLKESFKKHFSFPFALNFPETLIPMANRRENTWNYEGVFR
jgi:hypothetical protein